MLFSTAYTNYICSVSYVILACFSLNVEVQFNSVVFYCSCANIVQNNSFHNFLLFLKVDDNAYEVLNSQHLMGLMMMYENHRSKIYLDFITF